MCFLFLLKNKNRNYSAINLFDESQKRACRKRFRCNNIRVCSVTDADSQKCLSSFLCRKTKYQTSAKRVQFIHHRNAVTCVTAIL